jgi:hypothetical protein
VRVQRTQAGIFFIVFAYSLLGVGAFSAVMWMVLFPILISNQIKVSTFENLGLAPFLLLIGLTIFSAVVISPFSFNPYFIGRDLFYFSSAIVMMLIGYSIGFLTRDIGRLIWSVVIALAISSIVMFFPVIASGAIFSFSIAVRYSYALNSNLAVLGILLLLATWRTGVRLGTIRLRYLILFGMLFFVAASLSRVNVMVLAIGGAMIYFRSRWVSYAAMALVLALLIIPFLSLANQAGGGISDVSTSFVQKLAGSLSEIAIQDQYDDAGINLNWRGYEAFLGVNAVNQNGWPSILAGLGLGSYVEGPFIDKLNIIPIFHNGYVTVYVKGGILGLIIFVYFLYRQAFPATRISLNAVSAKNRARLLYFQKLSGLLVVSLAVRTLSTHGIIFPSPPLELLILGVLHGARYKIVTSERAVVKKHDAPPIRAPALV